MRRLLAKIDWNHVMDVVMVLVGVYFMFRGVFAHDVYWLVLGWIIWWTAVKVNERDARKTRRKAD